MIVLEPRFLEVTTGGLNVLGIFSRNAPELLVPVRHFGEELQHLESIGEKMPWEGRAPMSDVPSGFGKAFRDWAVRFPHPRYQ
jgi:hypothetical protein